MNIYFSDWFNRFAPEFGIRRNHVERAVLDPDKTKDVIPDDGLAIKFFCKHITQTTPPHWLLVYCRQEQNEDLSVDMAYRLYSDLHPDFGSLTPTEMLYELTQRFGIEVEVGEQKRKLILQETIEAAPGQNEIPLTKIQGSQGSEPISSMYFRIREDEGRRVFDCVLVYSLDTEKYLAYLQANRSRR